jgi:hypothetical protein
MIEIVEDDGYISSDDRYKYELNLNTPCGFREFDKKHRISDNCYIILELIGNYPDLPISWRPDNWK